MPEETPAPEEGTAEVTPETIDDAYDAAELDLGIGKEASEAPAEKAAPAEEETAEEEPVEEPEHIKWAKSIEGDYDKETGELIPERVAKRAYELNKQYQPTAQRNAELNKLLLHPEIYPHVARIMSGTAPPAKEETKEPETEKTEEQILEEFVDGRAKKLVEPLQQQNELLFKNYHDNQVSSTYQRLKESFGNDDDGNPVYDTISAEVGRQVAHQASLMKQDPQTFIGNVVRHGLATGNHDLLFNVFSSAARNVLFPRLVEQNTEKKGQAERQAVDRKKKAALPKKGTPSKSVSADKEIKTFDDAVKEAEREMKEAGIPVPE
jgi:hypothetical protein